MITVYLNLIRKYKEISLKQFLIWNSCKWKFKLLKVPQSSNASVLIVGRLTNWYLSLYSG